MEWTRKERQALAQELAGRLRGEVRFGDADRALYSTDASIYQVMPIGVVLPADADDAAEAIRICLDAGAPVLPRGGATSLAGQTVGRAVVLDFTRNVDAVVEIDVERRRAIVEPGVIQTHLNTVAGAHGLMFGPDTASGSRTTLGGMLGNNSAGSRSILYRKTVDHVRWVDAVCADGAVRRLQPVPVAELERRAAGEGLEAGWFQLAKEVREDYAAAIRKRFPSVMRRVSGYNLDELLGEEEINLARLLVGSEGSLATALRMEVDLVPAPKLKGIALCHFTDLEPAIEATNVILPTGPSAVELMDQMLLDLAAAHPSFKPKLWFMTPETKALQLVEFYADSEAELEEKFGRLEATMAGFAPCKKVTRANNALQVYDAWAIRKAGLPLLSSIPTDRKPLPFVEDTAVDPEKLPAFVMRFKEIVDAHETQAAYYAHASAGCLHIRPLLDLHDEEDRARLESISEAIFELVVEFGGSMSGEHGDGRVRSHFNSRLFGDELYQVMRKVKRAFDPRNLFNPGQVVDSPAMGDDLRADFPIEVVPPSTGLSWEPERGFKAAVEACNGTAACRKLDSGTMCPSFMATKDEEHSTRGRANLLRSAMSGAMPREELFGETIQDAMELCLMCKACKSECPVKVDMAKLKSEWLHWKHREQGIDLGSWARDRARTWMDLASWTPRLANACASTPLARKAAEWTMGMDTRRELPRFAVEGFRSHFARRDRPTPDGPGGKAVLFADCFSLHMTPRPLLDATWLLERAGVEVVAPPSGLGCCGRPAMGQGDLDLARKQAEHNVTVLTDGGLEALPVVGVEPGCLSMLWDDYPDLVGAGYRKAAKDLAQRTRLLEEQLLELVEAGFDPGWSEVDVPRMGLHPHCHQEALGKLPATQQALGLVPGLEVRRLGGGCCGMAGDFGHMQVDVSKRIFARTEAADWPRPLVAPGWSCRKQMGDHGLQEVYSAASVLKASAAGERLEV